MHKLRLFYNLAAATIKGVAEHHARTYTSWLVGFGGVFLLQEIILFISYIIIILYFFDYCKKYFDYYGNIFVRADLSVCQRWLVLSIK